MTQLEQINNEKESLKKSIIEHVERLNHIVEGSEMGINIILHYHKSESNINPKLVKCDVDIKLEI